MKVVINQCYGGFGLSVEGVLLYEELGGTAEIGRSEYHGKTYFNYYSIPRNDPILVKVVEQLGDKANDKYANLVVVEVPDDAAWHVAEYDGNEWVAEGRTWP